MAKPDLRLKINDAKNRTTIMLTEEDENKNGVFYRLVTFLESVLAKCEEDLNLAETPETLLTYLGFFESPIENN